MSGPLIELTAASAAIGPVELLSDIDLRVERGRCRAIVGESGSGKSLTCRVMTGLLGRLGGRVTRGSVRFDGIDLLSLSARQWRQLRGRRIGFIPQNSLSGLDPLMKVRRQVAETLRELRHTDASTAELLELMELVEMPRARDVLASYPHELSGGMRQRVMIAMGVAGRPDLLIADEPTTALDVTVQREILDVLARLRAELGMGLIFVSHDLGLVSAISDTVTIMYAGATIENGPTRDVLEAPGHPYTAALLASRPLLSASQSRLKVVAGGPPDPREWPKGCRFAPRCAYAEPACRDALPPQKRLNGDRWTRCLFPERTP